MTPDMRQCRAGTTLEAVGGWLVILVILIELWLGLPYFVSKILPYVR